MYKRQVLYERGTTEWAQKLEQQQRIVANRGHSWIIYLKALTILVENARIPLYVIEIIHFVSSFGIVFTKSRIWIWANFILTLMNTIFTGTEVPIFVGTQLDLKDQDFADLFSGFYYCFTCKPCFLGSRSNNAEKSDNSDRPTVSVAGSLSFGNQDAREISMTTLSD